MEGDEGLNYEDSELTQGSPCEICGSVQFYNESGFYYCTVCSTQSQQSREFVVEETFVSGRLNARAAGVLRNSTSKKSKNADVPERQRSMYEVLNGALKVMTDQLIDVGFPHVLKDQVFQLWMTYLKKRETIFVSQSKETVDYPVTFMESAVNKRAFFNISKPKPIQRRGLKPKKKIKDNLPLKNLESVSLKKKRRSMNQRSAFQMEYHSNLNQEDTPYANGDDSLRNQPIMKTEQKEINKVRMKKTRQFGLLASALKAEGLKIGTETEITKEGRLSTVLAPEIFETTKLLSLLFIALRQIGCSVLLSDILRMMSDGTISLPRETNSGMYNVTYVPPHHLREFRQTTFQLITFFGGVERFNNPTYAEFLPKFVDGLALPRELECLAIQLDRLVPQKEDESIGKEQNLTPELYVLSVLIIALKMLFGLDGVTEKYQSEFARTVNEVIASAIQTDDPESLKTDWIELFVIEDWINYLRYREYLVKSELYAPEMHNPLSTPNLNTLNHIFDKFSVPNLREKKSSRTTPTEVNQRKETVELFQSLFGEITTSVPSQVPNYVTFGVPNQSLVYQFKENYPCVFRPEFHPQFLKEEFLKKRIDFVYNPNNYIDLLKDANYEVHIRKGDARNYKPCTRKNINSTKKRLVLFQPYRNFDCDTNYTGLCSPTFDFILNECSSLLCNRQSVPTTRTVLEPAIVKLYYHYMKICHHGWVPVLFPDYLASDTDSDEGI